MTYPVREVESVVAALVASKAKMATKYVDEKTVVRATVFGKLDSRNLDIRLKIGRPAFADRKFIADCKKAGESFPVKRIQLRFAPKRKR